MNAPRSPCVCSPFARSAPPSQPSLRARHGRALPRFVSPPHTRPLLSRRVFFVQTSFPFYGTDFSLCRARFLASTRLHRRPTPHVFQLLRTNERTFSPLLSAAIPVDSIYHPPPREEMSTRRVEFRWRSSPRARPSRYFESIFRIEPTTFRREVINRNTRIEKGETARGDELQRPNRDKGRYHLEQRGERERLPRSDPTYSRAAR